MIKDYVFTAIAVCGSGIFLAYCRIYTSKEMPKNERKAETTGGALP